MNDADQVKQAGIVYKQKIKNMKKMLRLLYQQAIEAAKLEPGQFFKNVFRSRPFQPFPAYWALIPVKNATGFKNQ